MARSCRTGVAVVDDDDDVLDSFRFLLEVAGFRVATYSSAQAYLQEQEFCANCLILDQNMPRMTGLELAARLRADGRELPMLLVTACPSDAVRTQAAIVGVARVLSKPPAEHDLIAFVASC